MTDGRDLEASLEATLGARGERHRLAFDTIFGPVSGSVFVCRRGEAASRLKLLLLHGVGSTAASWARLLPALSELGECAAVDLLGHGRSPADTPHSATLSAQTWLVPALLEALGWSSAVLVGHSMGGGACLGAALCWPRRIEALVLIGSVAYPQPVPALFWPCWLPGSGTALAAACRLGLAAGLDRWMARRLGYDPRSARDYLACLADLERARTVAGAIRDLRPSAYRRYGAFYRQLRQPALLVHGTRDDFVPTMVPRRLAAELPDVRLRWIERAQHIPQETHAEQVLAHIRAFLGERLGAAGGRRVR